MLASVASEMPVGAGWVFEPKYDGIRVLAHASGRGVRLMTRNGKDKALQFPEIVGAMEALVSRSGDPLVLDGEIVALDQGDPARFQSLQSRMHATSGIAAHAERTPAAFIAFDLLRDGDAILLDEPWSVRRARLTTPANGVTPDQTGGVGSRRRPADACARRGSGVGGDHGQEGGCALSTGSPVG